MIKARGGIIGPDLSNLGGQRKVQDIADALTKLEHKIAADGGTHDTTLLPMSHLPAGSRHDEGWEGRLGHS